MAIPMKLEKAKLVKVEGGGGGLLGDVDVDGRVARRIGGGDRRDVARRVDRVGDELPLQPDPALAQQGGQLPGLEHPQQRGRRAGAVLEHRDANAVVLGVARRMGGAGRLRRRQHGRHAPEVVQPRGRLRSTLATDGDVRVGQVPVHRAAQVGERDVQPVPPRRLTGPRRGPGVDARATRAGPRPEPDVGRSWPGDVRGGWSRETRCRRSPTASSATRTCGGCWPR